MMELLHFTATSLVANTALTIQAPGDGGQLICEVLQLLQPC